MAETAVNLGRVSVAPRGAYSPTETYDRLDVVQYDGSSYIVLQDGTSGVTPEDGENYMLLTERGEAGEAGPKGDKGDTGTRGSAGPGVASGGTVGQVLVKTGSSSYATGWKTLGAGDVGMVPVSGWSDFEQVTTSEGALNDWDIPSDIGEKPLMMIFYRSTGSSGYELEYVNTFLYVEYTEYNYIHYTVDGNASFSRGYTSLQFSGGIESGGLYFRYAVIG